MIVADTNLIAYLLIEGSPKLSGEAAAVFARDPVWAAPTLWRSEFANVLSTHLRVYGKSLEQVQAAMRSAEAILHRHETMADHARVLELAAASGRSAYDCEFVEVAERLGVTLVTSDVALRKAFPGIAVSMRGFTGK